MDLYTQLVRPLLFRLDPEDAHTIVATLGRHADSVPLLPEVLRKILRVNVSALRTRVCDIDFENPVGLAAGFDKTGDLYPFLVGLGFGFVESGTFTFHEQPGNPRPRIFRIQDQEALLNRMGFNNPGAVRARSILRRQKRSIPRGINIGKSKVTELSKAVMDYRASLDRLSDFGDYVAVNVSSPNTPGLRELQNRESLLELLTVLRDRLRERAEYKRQHGRIVAELPLFVKIAPDLTDEGFEDILAVSLESGVRGIIISNTTIDKSMLPETWRAEAGGVSGLPVGERSLELIRRAFARAGKQLAIIGVGGIRNGADALVRIQAGASLVQVYTGLIYEGPLLVRQINRYLADYMEANQCTLDDVRGSAI